MYLSKKCIYRQGISNHCSVILSIFTGEKALIQITRWYQFTRMSLDKEMTVVALVEAIA
jgi:hypothetical protein